MTEPTKEARDGYAAFRGSFRDGGAPKHWDDLTEQEQSAFICVVQWGMDAAASRSRPPGEGSDEEVASAIALEKQLCLALVRKWRPAGMSLATLVDEACVRLSALPPAPSAETGERIIENTLTAAWEAIKAIHDRCLDTARKREASQKERNLPATHYVDQAIGLSHALDIIHNLRPSHRGPNSLTTPSPDTGVPEGWQPTSEQFEAGAKQIHYELGTTITVAKLAFGRALAAMLSASPQPEEG